MPLEFGDVVLVPYPFTSQRASRVTPRFLIPKFVNSKIDILDAFE
jgi:hypothetical protein